MSAVKLLELYGQLTEEEQSMVKALVSIAPMLQSEKQVPALLDALLGMQEGVKESEYASIIEPELKAFGEFLSRRDELGLDYAV
jgi:hypothetical protein